MLDKINIKDKFYNFFLQKRHLPIGRIVLVFLAIMTLFLSLKCFQLRSDLNRAKEIQVPNTDYTNVEVPVANMTNWHIFKNDWYGFQMQYPNSWKKPIEVQAAKEDKWEKRIEFRSSASDGNPIIGFDVVIYDVGSVKELYNTDEYPTFRSAMNENETCRFIAGHLKENDEFPAEELYIPVSDDCRNPAFFYTLIKDAYIYNIVPAFRENANKPANMKKFTIKNLPDFFSAAASFKLIDVIQPGKKTVKKIVAPIPVAAKTLPDGTMVCPRKHDRPSYSKLHKGLHLDEDCCMDPDEYPNPHCGYPKKHD